MNKTLAFVFVLIAGAHAVAVAKPSASEPSAAASHQEPVTVFSQQSPAQGGQPIVVPSGYASAGQHFSPAGIVSIAGEKPYGQPESSGIPSNYKPFGSWGLYIGGNPADGYYSNYYKGAGGESSVKPAGEKPESGKPLYAAPSGAYGYSGEYVPVGYSQVPPTGAEFEPSPAQPESYSASATKKSAFPSGQETKSDSQFKKESKGYSPVFEQRSSYAQRVYVYPPAPNSPAYPGYAYNSPVYAYGSPAGAYAASAGPYASPAGAYASPSGQAGPGQVAGAQQQVIPYPVPVGSHIMGSQPGVEGAYYPYGVHAYTKYVVKPVVGEASYAPVSSIEKASSSGSSSSSSSFSGPQQSGVYSPSQFVYSKSYYVSPAGQQQQPHYSPYYSPYYYSGNYYGFPLGQLHYSNDGSYSPGHEVQPQPQQQGPVYQGAQFGPVGVKPIAVEEGVIKPEVSVEAKKAKA